MMTIYCSTGAYRIVLSCAILLIFGSAPAAVNPELFRDGLIARAPEWLTIEVVAAKKHRPSPGTRQVVASAIVRSVERSATALEPGMTILIVYTVDVAAEKSKMAKMEEQAKQGWAGMQSEGLPVAIEANMSYVAHLRALSGEGASGRVYVPVAAIYSFEPVTTSPQGP